MENYSSLRDSLKPIQLPRSIYMDFICAKCHQKLEKDSAILAKGCHHCGSKVFITRKTSNAIMERTTSQRDHELLIDKDNGKVLIRPLVLDDHSQEEKRKEELMADHLPAVKLREKGVYEVNINGLFRGSKTDPIILSGRPGIYRVEFLQKRKK